MDYVLPFTPLPLIFFTIEAVQDIKLFSLSRGFAFTPVFFKEKGGKVSKRMKDRGRMKSRK